MYDIKEVLRGERSAFPRCAIVFQIYPPISRLLSIYRCIAPLALIFAPFILTMDSSSSHFITLPPSHEYRIELDPPDSLAVRTHPSSPPTYINNQELPPNTWYPLYPDSRLSIWNPSTTEEVRLEMTSEPTGAYESGMSTWGFVRNLHLGLEGRRIMAKRAIKARHLAGGGGMMDETKAELRKEEMGPRVMVLGGASAGKSTLVKGLVNLALSSGMGWGVGVVGLDPSNVSELLLSVQDTRQCLAHETTLLIRSYKVYIVPSSHPRKPFSLHPLPSRSHASPRPSPRLSSNHLDIYNNLIRRSYPIVVLGNERTEQLGRWDGKSLLGSLEEDRCRDGEQLEEEMCGG